MEKRMQELSELQKCTDTLETELTMILQSLQWNQNSLLEKPFLETCKYDQNHRMPANSKESHEKLCFLKFHGYSPNDKFLPDAPQFPGNSLVKLGLHDVKVIVNQAASNNPSFTRGNNNYPIQLQGVGSSGPEPLTLDRLQSTYSTDERRAIHDAVVQAAPSLHDLSDLALFSGPGEVQERRKTRLEVLAELRDMRRRRAKYRGAAHTSKYSHVLRDLIKTQMEFFSSTVNVQNKEHKINTNQNIKTEKIHRKEKNLNKTYSKYAENYETDNRNYRRVRRDDDKSHKSYRSREDKYKHQSSDYRPYEQRHKDIHNSHRNSYDSDDRKPSYKSYYSTTPGSSEMSRDERHISDSREHKRSKRDCERDKHSESRDDRDSHKKSMEREKSHSKRRKY